MREEIIALDKKTNEEIDRAKTQKEVDEIRVRVFGKKGTLAAILKQMGKLSNEERPKIGELANRVRNEIDIKIKNKIKELKEAEIEEQIENEKIDITLPGKKTMLGRKHPLTAMLDEIEEIFIGMGFSIADGPEIETDYYNFEALNLPKDHPARDEQDTFYIDNNILLRTQTSPVQIRVMEKSKPPIKIIAPGRVYRTDTIDATHSPIFNQIEGLVVDKGVKMSDLKGTLEEFVKRLYGSSTKVRFRPHHFPFTEPSAEMDFECFSCHGKGCSICKGEGYIEMLGCGMVHPKVLENCNIDSSVYSGFAFGMGLERIAMRNFKIDDLRLFYENDIRFLKQF